MGKKPRGHFCRICHQRKSNEKFSGRGHAAHICKACAKRGNKPPDINDDPLVFVDEDFIDTEDYLFGGGDYFFDGYFFIEEEQPVAKKKIRLRQGETTPRRAEESSESVIEQDAFERRCKCCGHP